MAQDCRRRAWPLDPENTSPNLFRGALSQDGLLGFQIFFNGFYAIAGIGDADGVVPAQFVMHQQFANHSHFKFCFRHAPELTGFQVLLANAAGRLDFCHGPSCALSFGYTS
jgi:hypothetical protein